MRILGMLLLGAGLLLPGLGCCHTVQVTTGVCDCDPPPVQSLLASPTPAHPSLGVYGSIAHAPVPVEQGTLPKAEFVPVMPKVEPLVK